MKRLAIGLAFSLAIALAVPAARAQQQTPPAPELAVGA